MSKKKDAMYSLRISREVRKGLQVAAEKDRRTVASLLDKIITDYLAKEGLLKEPEVGPERRKFPRKKVAVPASAFLEENRRNEAYPCVILNLSMGGALVSYPKSPKIKYTSPAEMPQFRLKFKVPPEHEEVWFDCNACHMQHSEKELQVGANFSSPEGIYMQRVSKFIM